MDHGLHSINIKHYINDQSRSKAKKSGQATCEYLNLAMHPLDIFESLIAILAEAINENCKIVNSLLLYWRRCIDCSIRVSH